MLPINASKLRKLGKKQTNADLLIYFSLKTFLRNNYRTNKEESKISTFRVKEAKPITLNGYSALFWQTISLENGKEITNNPIVYVFDGKGNSIIAADGLGTNTELILKILSTFKFTNSQDSKSFLEIPEYGVKFALTENIKDAYDLPQTASKGYIYLKVHSLDSEPKCKSDPSSTAAIARQGKNDPMPFDLSYEEFKNRFPGTEIGNNYYYIDLAQYACADSAAGRTLLDKVRKEFSAASKTITAL